MREGKKGPVLTPGQPAAVKTVVAPKQGAVDARRATPGCEHSASRCCESSRRPPRSQGNLRI